MKKMRKFLILAVVAVLGTTVVSSVEAISSDEAVQSALARVPGATVANVTEFNRDYGVIGQKVCVTNPNKLENL